MNDGTSRYRRELGELIARTAYERRNVVLSSGRHSDYYLDCRRVTLDPEGARLCGIVLYAQYRAHLGRVAAVGGPSMGADPLVTAFSLRALEKGERLPGYLIRKEAKGHGLGNRIEGLYGVEDGARVLLLEDVLTTGGSLLQAFDATKERGLDPIAAMVLVDREEGGVDSCAEVGLDVTPVFKASEVSSIYDRL